MIWINEPYDHLTVRNNHIICRTTATPRTEGLFGFAKECDFSTFLFEDNLIECEGQARPFFRNDESAKSSMRNNRLVNVSDTSRYTNTETGNRAGLEQPLKFDCGVHGEVAVDGWNAVSAKGK